MTAKKNTAIPAPGKDMPLGVEHIYGNLYALCVCVLEGDRPSVFG